MERFKKSYLDGFAAGHMTVQHGVLTVHEIVDSLHADPEDDSISGRWIRGYMAAIRSAFGR